MITFNARPGVPWLGESLFHIGQGYPFPAKIAKQGKNLGKNFIKFILKALVLVKINDRLHALIFSEQVCRYLNIFP